MLAFMLSVFIVMCVWAEIRETKCLCRRRSLCRTCCHMAQSMERRFGQPQAGTRAVPEVLHLCSCPKSVAYWRLIFAFAFARSAFVSRIGATKRWDKWTVPLPAHLASRCGCDCCPLLV